ncbi:MAG TPA: Clp protease N-terminal domain-containing protein [Vicinamibacterales bacterium]|nr:Clp protease N-terminal domain-containing protein [Vicinamibacterales bacterium]
MFDRFTVPARMTLFAARVAVTDLRDTELTPQHILLGLLRADDGPLPGLFARAGMSYLAIRNEVRASDPSRASRPEVPSQMEVPLSAGTKRALDYAVSEADRLEQQDVGTGHLLLGVIADADSQAARIITRHAITAEGVRAAILVSTEFVEREPPPQDGLIVRLVSDPEPIRRVERVRLLVEQMEQHMTEGVPRDLLLDEIHGHLDALKRHVLDAK